MFGLPARRSGRRKVCLDWEKLYGIVYMTANLQAVKGEFSGAKQCEWG
jgi:hypothetical protein